MDDEAVRELLDAIRDYCNAPGFAQFRDLDVGELEAKATERTRAALARLLT